MGCVATVEAHHFSVGEEPGAEDPGLLVGLTRQFRTADSPCETEVVADHRARPRLTTDRPTLDNHRVQAFGGAVDRSSEAGRAGSHHRDIEMIGTEPGGGRTEVTLVTDRHLVRRSLFSGRPLVEQTSHRPMEGFVGWLQRLGEVVIHAAAGDRRTDGVSGTFVAPVARRDEQHPLRPGVQ